jgi:hypothetical protein
MYKGIKAPTLLPAKSVYYIIVIGVALLTVILVANLDWTGVGFGPTRITLLLVLVGLTVLTIGMKFVPESARDTTRKLAAVWALGGMIYFFPTISHWTSGQLGGINAQAASQPSQTRPSIVRTLIAPLGEFSTEAIEIPPACDWDIQVTGAVDKLTPSGQKYTIWPKNRSNIGVAPVADVGPCRFRTNEVETKPATVTVTWTPWSQERIAAYWRDHR